MALMANGKKVIGWALGSNEFVDPLSLYKNGAVHLLGKVFTPQNDYIGKKVVNNMNSLDIYDIKGPYAEMGTFGSTTIEDVFNFNGDTYCFLEGREDTLYKLSDVVPYIQNGGVISLLSHIWCGLRSLFRNEVTA